MGQNISRGSEQVDISINHPKFLQGKILTQSNKEILKTTVPCDEKAYKTWKELLQKYKSIHHEYLLLPLKHKFKSSGVCATRGSVEIQFENHPYLLTEEIHNRKGKKNPFTQPELWYLLYAYLSTKKFLLQNAEYPYTLIGDVRPDNVFVNQNGEVKFSNLLSWPGQKLNYKKTFDGITTYLSPQDYELLQLGLMNNEKNQKSEFFSIGLTLVSAIILKDNSDIYNIEKQRFDHNEAKKRINTFKCMTVYSQLLRAIISSFCQFEPKRRIEFSDLWLWITKYERRIMAKQSFMIDEVPPKINEHINFLRTQILALQPGTSTLNIKSLRGSQAKNEMTSGKKATEGQWEKSQIKYLKQVDKTKSELETEKRKSRIVINTGEEQKIFYSPNNASYFTSHAPERSQISQLRSKLVGQQGSKIQTFYSPPRPLQTGNFQYERQKVAKSPDGFYSPKSGNQQFRVFIQYKSPPKPIQKPYAETIYLGKQGQQQSVVVMKSMDETGKRKNSDSKSQKSQKSGDSNRQNRFIEETKRENEYKKKVEDISNKQIKSQVYKKQSPIQQIIDYESMSQVVSEVVSEEIIISTEKKEQKLQGVNEVAQGVEDSVDDGQRIQIVSEQKINNFNEIEEYQSGMVNQEQVLKLQEQTEENKVHEQPKLSDQARLKIQEEINKLTFDNGDDRVPSSRENFQKTEQQQQKQHSIKQVQHEERENVSPFEQIVDEIFPNSLENAQQQQTQQNTLQLQARNQQTYEQTNTYRQVDQQAKIKQVQHEAEAIESVNHNEAFLSTEQPLIEQLLSTEEIIDNEISSEKEPENSFHGSRHSDLKLDDNFGTLNTGNNKDNILILDEPADSEPEIKVQNLENAQDNDQQAEQNLQQQESNPVETHNQENDKTDEYVTKLQQRLLIPLGPQPHHQHIDSPIQKLQTFNNIHEKENQQVLKIQYNIEIAKTLEKNLQSPFEQIEQQDISQFHSSRIVQVIEIQPNTVSIEQDSLNLSTNQPQQQLQHQNTLPQPQFQFNLCPHQELIQEITDISLRNDGTLIHYQTQECQHEVLLGNDQNDEKMVYNVIEVNDISNPLDNGIDKDSAIQGSGDSNIIDKNQDFINFQQTEQVLTPQVDYQEHFFAVKPQNDQITIEQVGQKVVVRPNEQIKEETNLKHSLHNSERDIKLIFDDPFLKDVQQTNQKLNELKEQQKYLNQRDEIERQEIKQELVHQTVQEVQENAQNKEILPVESNQKLSLHPIQEQQIRLLQAQPQKLQTQPSPLQTQNLQNQPQSNQLPMQENYLHFSNLQVSLPRAPTQSQFGNISEIMDIHKVFNNTLNSKERNFLEATADPRSEEFLKELINLSQKGAIQQSDLQKVHMSKQDRDRLTTFMKKWQQYNPQHQESARQYINQFRQAITRSQNENSPISEADEQGKLHMSAQDKETLKLVVQRLNIKNRNLLDQLQQSPAEKKSPANYDQSYVEIKYSELKTEIIVGQKDDEKEKNEVQVGSEMERYEEITKIINENDKKIQNSEQITNDPQFKPRLSIGKGTDIIDEVIQINRKLNNQSEQNYLQQENQPYTLQSVSPNQQHTETLLIEDRNNSQVNASIGQKSEREDPLNMQIDLNKVTQNQSVQNLHILENHRTYSQPNDLFQRGTFSEDLSPRSNKQRHIQHKDTITEDFQQNEELTEILPENDTQEQIQKSQLTHNKLRDFIEEVTEINEVIKNSVEQIVEDPIVISVEQIKLQTPAILEPQKLKVQPQAHLFKRTSPRTVRKTDFLDEVMQVNRIINREENKDYYKNNKYLHEQNQEE